MNQPTDYLWEEQSHAQAEIDALRLDARSLHVHIQGRRTNNLGHPASVAPLVEDLLHDEQIDYRLGPCDVPETECLLVNPRDRGRLERLVAWHNARSHVQEATR